MFCWGGFLYCGIEAFYPCLVISGLCLAWTESYSVSPRQNFESCPDRILCLAKAESCGMPRQNLASCQGHTLLTGDFQARSRNIFGQCVGYDLALDERSQAISGIFLHRNLPRIFLDGSGLGLELWRGYLLRPIWENGCQVRVGNRQTK